MKHHHIEIASDQTGRSTRVVMDGEPVEKLVAVSFEATANDVNRVVMVQIGAHVVISADAQVEQVYRCLVTTTFGVGIPEDIVGEGKTPEAAAEDALHKLLAMSAVHA